MKLKNNIRRCRFDNNEMSQEDLAKKIGVTRQTIYSIEKEKFIPSVLLAIKLAEFFNKPVEDIFYLRDEDQV